MTQDPVILSLWLYQRHRLIIAVLPNHDLELHSSSLTLGRTRASSVLLSLNHDLVAILDIETLMGLVDADALYGIVDVGVLLVMG